jgi:sugar/nucleoside kinase (ribokinase family)
MRPRRSNLASPSGLFVGLATVDVSYTVDEIPRRNQKISVKAQRVTAGGPATNAAATFAFLGGRTTLVTAVGSHPLARAIREDLSGLSIRIHDMARERHESPPVSSVMVDRATGDRTVVSANAAVFSPLKGKLDPRWLAGVSIVQLDGQYMPLCIAAAQAAREHGIPVVLDSGSWKPGMAGLLKLVDTVICSGDFRPPGCRSHTDVFDYLAARKIIRVAITRGGSATRFVDGAKRGEISVPQIRPVDTLGAGDIFHGAFCYYASRPEVAFREALAAAAQVASFSTKYSGARSWMRHFRNVAPRKSG